MIKQNLKTLLDGLSVEELKEVVTYCRTKKKRRPDPLNQLARQKWLELYEQLTGSSYYWSAKDAMAAHLLVNRIKAKLSDTFTQSQITDEIAMQSFGAFIIATWRLNNSFYRDNFSPAIINSKFNELYFQIKNGGKSKISNDYKSRILSDLNS